MLEYRLAADRIDIEGSVARAEKVDTGFTGSPDFFNPEELLLVSPIAACMINDIRLVTRRNAIRI